MRNQEKLQLEGTELLFRQEITCCIERKKIIDIKENVGGKKGTYNKWNSERYNL